MKEQKLLEKLRRRRELLDFSQDYMGMKLDMSQPAYCLIENGQTRLTEELLKKIKTIEGFEDFDKEPSPAVEISAANKGIPIWPWGRTSLNITLAVAGLLLLNLASMFADDVSRGFVAGAEPEPDPVVTVVIAVILLALFVGIIYLHFRLAKWLLNLRRKWKNTLMRSQK